LVAECARRYPAHPALGEGLCFLFNALSNIAVLVAMVRIGRLVPTVLHETHALPHHPAHDRSIWGGFRYLSHRPHLRALLLFNAIMAILAIPYLILMPVYAKSGLGGDVTVLSHLMASVGFGAIMGGTVMARRSSIKGLATHMGISAIGFSLCVALASQVRSPMLANGVMGLAGFFMVMAMIGANTLAQTLTVPAIRGRVLTLFNMASVGLMPVGSLLMGGLAKATDIRTALLVCAVGTGGATVLFARRLPELRRQARKTEEYQSALS
jgi:hypothetical protein